MFEFGMPRAFLLLLLLIPVIWRLYRRGQRTGVLFAPMQRLPGTRRGWRHLARALLPFLFLVGLIGAVIAAARPRTVLSRIKQTKDVIAIQMVVDVSGSMEALDLSEKTPTGLRYRTRLDVVKNTFADFVTKRPDDLIGLVSFAGYASTRSPLTPDHDALLHVLKGVEIPDQDLDGEGNPRDMEELLTAIGDALATAVARLRKSEPKSKIIVLLSDGESNTGLIQPAQATAMAKELEIKVYTIGVGTSGLAPFFARDRFGRRKIERVEVSMDETQLKEIAEQTGGRYFNVSDPKGLEQALEEIDTLEKTEVDSSSYVQFKELFPWFLVPAVAVLLGSVSLHMLMTRRLL